MDPIAYTIGLFDGEGCVSVASMKRGGWTLRAVVQMDQEAPIRLMQQVWGGVVYQRATTRGVRPWVWQASAQAARPLFAALAEHSLTKRRQAEIALQIADEMAAYLRGDRGGAKTCLGEKAINHEARAALVRELRSCNGGRSRFGQEENVHVTPTP